MKEQKLESPVRAPRRRGSVPTPRRRGSVLAPAASSVRGAEGSLARVASSSGKGFLSGARGALIKVGSFSFKRNGDGNNGKEDETETKPPIPYLWIDSTCRRSCHNTA